MQIGLLEARIKELECTSTMSLAKQADTLLKRDDSITTGGPDTYEHFCEFSINKVIKELQEQTPLIYAHFMQLGNIQRTTSDDEMSGVNKLKAVSALCTLLNARSNRVKGLQLLMSMMLIGRSVGKQVHVHSYIQREKDNLYNTCTVCIRHAYTCVSFAFHRP